MDEVVVAKSIPVGLLETPLLLKRLKKFRIAAYSLLGVWLLLFLVFLFGWSFPSLLWTGAQLLAACIGLWLILELRSIQRKVDGADEELLNNRSFWAAQNKLIDRKAGEQPPISRMNLKLALLTDAPGVPRWPIAGSTDSLCMIADQDSQLLYLARIGEASNDPLKDEPLPDQES